MEKLWKIEDTNDMLIELTSLLGEKCAWGENIQVLSLPERTVYIALTTESEIMNGGFDQFFNNSAGNFSGEIAEVFTRIGAVQIAAICQKALSAFGRELPADWTQRQELLEEICSDEIYDVLEKCDDAFYELPEDLDQLIRAYALQNQNAFS